LVVSGGHTLLVAMDDHGKFRVLGQTVDDAAGEAFDKIARFLGLGYPGGPAIDRIARDGDPNAIAFPRPMRGDGHDFSFSGLKTAVVQYVRKHPEAEIADVAASFQAAIVDVLVDKLLGAADEDGISTVVIGGGVAANSALRARMATVAEETGLRVVIPPVALCTDNAAMVGAVAAYRLGADGPTSLDGAVVPNLRL
jgi:N6-L-threonylcarbamoyladenine synthase